MQNKKNKNADLEKFRFAMLFLGLGIAVVSTLSAFEFTSFERARAQVDTDDINALNEELIELPEEKEEDKPEPPKEDVEKPEEEEEELELEVSSDEFKIDTTNTTVRKGPEIIITKKLEKKKVEEEILIAPPIMAQFDGNMYKYLSEVIKYPTMARDMGIEGKVYVKFIVGKNGKIRDAKLLNSIGGGCDEVALNAVKNMPKWKPAENAGEPVASYFTLPIKFKLEK
jgi:protein TonB